MTREEYVFKDFCEELGIKPYTYEKRREDLLEWLKEFYVYEIINSRPVKIIIHEELAEYKPIPRSLAEHKAMKKQKYEDYTKKALGKTYKYNSKSKIAREAIDEFGFENFGHYNQESVTKRYISKPFDEFGETNEKYHWCDFRDYEPLSDEQVKAWKEILKEEKIGRKEAALAFYKQESGEDISKEKSYYKKALKRFKEKYDITPVYVKQWKRKNARTLLF